MKKIYAIIAAIVLALPAFAQGGKDLYNKYSDLPGVSPGNVQAHRQNPRC